MNNNLSQNQFRYSTNMKDKPNSQGTLFGVDKSQRTPESRQPRGYSKDRYNAVTEALGVKTQNTRGSSWMGHEHGGVRMMVHSSHAETLARAVASVARSTVPMSDITKPRPDQPKSDDNPSLSIGINSKTTEEAGELGSYSAPGTTAIKGEGRIRISKGANGDDLTALHEIGHHVSHLRTGAPYKTADERGKEEGFADRYAQEHARTRGYNKKPVNVSSRPENWHQTLGSKLSPLQFDDGYHSVRPRPKSSYDPTPGTDGRPKEWIKGQVPLLHRSSSVWGNDKNVRWTYNSDLEK